MPWPRIVAMTATIAAFLIGVEYSAFFPAGPDQSGYVSQAHRWVTGQLRTPIPEWARAEEWANALKSAAPTGYAVDVTNTNLVPSYSPGLPLAMAVFEWIGGANAVFYVVALYGSLAVWATYALAAIPAALVIAAINTNWYGSALTSGYGSLDTLYAIERISVNARRYLGWLIHTQTPMVLLWTIAAFAIRALDTPRQIVLIVIDPAAVLA